jgi:hypothetical protein
VRVEVDMGMRMVRGRVSAYLLLIGIHRSEAAAMGSLAALGCDVLDL